MYRVWVHAEDYFGPTVYSVALTASEVAAIMRDAARELTHSGGSDEPPDYDDDDSWRDESFI